MDKYNVTFAVRGDAYSVEDAEAQVGRKVPVFVLESADHETVSIEDHRDREHVVLIFGSIT